MFSRRPSLFVLLFLVLALVLPGCPKKGDGGEDGKGDIYLALAGPLTGSCAACGTQQRMGAELKVREINEAGGLDGRTVHLLVEDDKGDPTEAMNVARKIVADDRVCIVIGHFNSNCTNAAKEEYNRKGIVSFSAASTNHSVCKGYDWTFRNIYRDDYQGRFNAHYCKKKLKVEKWAIFYENDDYGKGLMKSFKEEAEKIGVTVVGTQSYIRERTQDFSPLVLSIKEKEPQGIFISGLYNEGALICKAARTDAAMDVVFLGSDGVMNEDFIKIAGPAAEGAYIATPFVFNTGQDSPEAKSFYESFKKTYEKEPDTWAALAYDAVGMALDGIRAVGTNRKAIRDWLADRTTPEKGYKGVTGLTYFDKEGDCYSKGVRMARVKDGRFGAAPQMTVEEMQKD